MYGTCSYQCDTELCPAGQVCSSPYGFCDDGCDATRSECGPGMTCDPVAKACIDMRGQCGPQVACPTFSDMLENAGEVHCIESRCRVLPLAATASPAPFAEPQTIELRHPLAEARLPPEEDVEFQWSPVSGTSLVMVLDRPADIKEIARAARWAATVPEARCCAVHWSEGVSKDASGRWSNAPGELPTGVSYVLVQSLVRGARLTVSPLVPFHVGSAASAIGDHCEGALELPGTCINRDLPMGCVFNSCRALCASDEDCAPLGLGCGRPDLGVRVCE